MTLNAVRSTDSITFDEVPSASPRPQRHLNAVPARAAEGTHVPEPSDGFLRGLAAQAYEVVEGVRNLAQLGHMITVGASRQLQIQRSAMVERRSIYRDRHSRLVRMGRVRICRVLPEVVEATVVLHSDRRVHAVALRLEWMHARWRACEVTVL